MDIMNEQMLTLGIKSAGLLLVIALGFACYFLIRKGLIRLEEKQHITYPAYVITRGIVKWILLVLVLLVLLQSTGITVTTILAGLLTVAGMIAIGFIAVWSILSNVLCSLMLIVHRSFRINDQIEVVEPVGGQGLKGRVMEFNIMFTLLAEEIEGEEYVTQVPNNIFFQKVLRRKPGGEGESLGQHLLSRPLLFQTQEKIRARKSPDPA